MRKKMAIPVLLIILVSVGSPLAAQVFGQFAGAGAAAEGEGSVFMLAGNEAFRTGLSARFNISRISDFGVQLGLDRVSGESFFGGGFDLKLVFFESRPELPINLALDASFGGLDSGDVRRLHFGFGVLSSGVIRPATTGSIEPYLSFIVDVEQIDGVSSPGDDGECYACANGGDETDTDTIVRAGAKISLSQDSQIIVEAGLNDRARFGAAFNLVF